MGRTQEDARLKSTAPDGGWARPSRQALGRKVAPTGALCGPTPRLGRKMGRRVSGALLPPLPAPGRSPSPGRGGRAP
eukprot:5669405-Alexandrium_andersonii.AAC.1